MQITHYNEYLKDAYTQRLEKNKNYSLRSFARDLEIDPGQLSRVMAGKRNLSYYKAKYIADKLFNSSKKRSAFLAYFELATAKTPARIDAAQKKVAKLNSKKIIDRQINDDTIKFISEWYHIAILDLCLLSKFETTIINFANYLGVNEILVERSLARLMRLGLLNYRDGRYYKTNRVLNTTTNIPSAHIRKLHKSFISKGIDSIDQQPIEDRYIRGQTMSIRKNSLPKLQELIENFFKDVSELNHEADEHDSLYQLNVQLYDLKARK